MKRLTHSLASATVAGLLAFAALPAASAAQQEESGQAEENPVAELQQIQGQLMQLQEEAMQDPVLQEQQAELQEQITGVMREIDPETEAKVDRVNELQDELQTAQQEGDPEKVGSLLQEAQQLQGELQRTQDEAMSRQDVREAVDEFRVELFAKMIEIDPESEGLIQRAEELTAQLQGGQGS